MAKIHYDIPDLRAFSELARTGGFNRAAEALAITSSALSRRIAKLEAAVGGDLVARSTRGMSLTPLGQRLLARAEPLLSALDESVNEASRIARGLEGQVIVGCVSSIAYSLLPEAIAAFRSEYENVRVSLRDGEGPQVMNALQAQEVEFAITTFSKRPAEVVSEAIASDPFVVVCSELHPLAKQRRLTWLQLREYRLVGFRSSSSSRRVLDAALARHQLELDWFDEVDQLSSLVGYLRSGHFVGVVPRMLSRYIPHVVAVPVSGHRVERKIYLARRKDTPLSKTALALWQCVARVAGSQSSAEVSKTR